MANLQLKPGAISLINTLKKMGKKMAIFTEGPVDAQVRTTEKLGLGQYMDMLVTSDGFGVDKKMDFSRRYWIISRYIRR